jgi:hypothetical protein
MKVMRRPHASTSSTRSSQRAPVYTELSHLSPHIILKKTIFEYKTEARI